MEALELDGGERLEVDMVVISAGIVARDELAREAGLAVDERGGVIVDDALRTTDPRIYAIGEVAVHRGKLRPGRARLRDGRRAGAKSRAKSRLRAGWQQRATFAGADTSAKLKLIGVDVASFGDPFADQGPTNRAPTETW